MKYILVFSLCILTSGALAQEDLSKIPTFVREGVVQAVIEIPAGTNHKIEYKKGPRKFQYDKVDGKLRVIDFLPYPGNYGFIPSTLMDKKAGGDGDALDILVLSESVTTGDVLKVLPIATLSLKDGGEIDDKVIAVPLLQELQIIKATSLKELESNYPEVKNMIEQWFLNYKGKGAMELIGWLNKEQTLNNVKKWQIR